MMKISDALNDEELLRLARQTVGIGDVYRMKMTETNGIKLKDGADSRNKYFVVLGFDNKGIAYGGVIINSKINQNLPAHLKMYHMPLLKAKYEFLDHNSFVDCVSLKRAFPEKFSQWQYLGKIDEYDVELIIGTIKESPRENVAHLALYGL